MSTWNRADGVLSHHTLDTVVLLPLDHEDPLTIHGSGAEIWRRLTAPTAIDDLIDGLAQDHGEPRERIARDVLPFLEELERLGAVRRYP